MRIYFALIIASFLAGTTIIKAQQTEMFLPLQKPVTRKFALPAMPAFSLMLRTDSVKTISPKNALPLDFYSMHVGVACKMELKLEKRIKLPLRIRLGSKDQVDYLEGKYNRWN